MSVKPATRAISRTNPAISCWQIVRASQASRKKASTLRHSRTLPISDLDFHKYKLRYQSSLFLFLLFLFGHLNEWVLQHRHAGDQPCESFLLRQFLLVVSDALGDLIGSEADLILGEGLLHAHYLLLRVLYHPCLGFSEYLLEGFLLGRAAV